MSISYDKESDTLTIELNPEYEDYYESSDHDTGDFTITVDEVDSLLRIKIRNATQFVTQALAAGIEIEGGPTVEPSKSETVWYEADSSMISAFGYNEMTRELDVAFHRTGTYRYFHVPKHVFEGLRDASSQGRYMRDMIIDMYQYEKR